MPAPIGSALSVAITLSIGLEVTDVLIDAAVTGPVSAQSIDAVPAGSWVPLASGLATCTVICTDPDPPAATVPSGQETVAPERIPPPVAETKLAFAGTVPVRTTVVALALPLLPYDSV